MPALSNSVREFLQEPHFAVVATIAPDGVPHQTVVWYGLDGDDIIFTAPQGTVKHQHLQRDPRLSICIEQGFRYVTLSGTVSLETDQAMLQRDYLRLGERYRGAMQTPPPRPSAKASELMTRERVGIRLKVERVISQGIE